MDLSPEELAILTRIHLALGKIVFNFSGAEHQLRRLAWLLIDERADRTGEITLDALGGNGLENLVTVLAPYRLGASDPLTQRVISAVKQFAELRINRNKLVHSLWSIPNEASDLSGLEATKRKFRKGTQDKVAGSTAEPIELVVTESSVVIEELMALHDPVLSRLRSDD